MIKKKVIYYSTPYFFDYDLPLLKELGRLVDLYYILDVNPDSQRSTILNLKENNHKNSISSFSSFAEELPPDIHEYLDLNKCFLINRNKSSAKSLSNIVLQIKLYRFIKSLNGDILHVNNYLGFNALLPLFDIKIKKVLTFHDPLPHSSEINTYREKIKRLNIRKSTTIILHNKSQLEDFISNYKVPSNKVTYIPVGIYGTYSKYRKVEIDCIKNQVLFFGRISKYKGIEYLIEAAQYLVDNNIHFRLVIAGKGEMYFDHPLIHDSKYCTIINRYLGEEELAKLILESKIIVCPYTDATQSGVIMTSYALGKPVIATKTGGLPEMVIHNKTGYLVNPRDSNQLYFYLSEFLTNVSDINFEKNIDDEFLTGVRSWESIANIFLKKY